jgi:hypothetical protein
MLLPRRSGEFVYGLWEEPPLRKRYDLDANVYTLLCSDTSWGGA